MPRPTIVLPALAALAMLPAGAAAAAAPSGPAQDQGTARGDETAAPPAGGRTYELPPLDAPAQEREPSPYDWRLQLAGGVSYASTSVFQLWSANAQVRLGRALSDQVSVGILLEYGLDGYDIDDDALPDTWDNVHTFDVAARFDVQIDEHWSIFGGPVFQLAFEDGADLSEAWIAGGFVGATYQLEPGMSIGGGVSIVSQLQDEARLFPIIQVEWALTDDLRLTSITAATTVFQSGVELEYDLSRELTLAVGGAYQFKRFALDKDGFAARGVGEDRSLPVWGRMTWAIGEDVDLSLVGGLLLNGSLELERDSGAQREKDYNSAFFVRLGARIHF